MKKKLDWKEIGQFLSVLLNLFTIIRDTFKNIGVNLEIIQWFTEEGRDKFVENFLKPIGQEYGEFMGPRERIDLLGDGDTLLVNLDASAIPPEQNQKVILQLDPGNRWVGLQLLNDTLLVDGRRITFFPTKLQDGKRLVRGYDFFGEIVGQQVLHPNIMDALVKYPQFIPENWKRDENGNRRPIRRVGNKDFDEK